MADRSSEITPRTILRLLLVVVVIPCLPVLLTGRWDWWQAWVFALISVLGFALSRGLAARRHPDLIAERANAVMGTGTRSFDKLLAPLVVLGGLLLPPLAGLEARYGHTTGFGLPVEIIALAAILAGYIIGSWALIENRFFAGTVRIQTERGHTVVTSGPYRWIRHPGYLGALVTYLATPFLLGSAWAIAPAILLVFVLIVRTQLEDQVLQQDLPGYRQYAARVRHRLLPGIW